MAVTGVNYQNYKYNQGNKNIKTIDDDNGVSRTTGNSTLGMNDFLTLMAAQMSNQDMMNPVSDTDFIAQMAQFSALEGVNKLQEYVLSSYAVSYTGKHVIISHQNETTRRLETVYGQVERVTFMSGQPKVVVNGKEYDLYTVMEIADKPIQPPSAGLTGLVGQYAAVEKKLPDGTSEIIFGQIESVTYYDGKNRIMVKGDYYDYPDSVKQISKDEINSGNYDPSGELPSIDDTTKTGDDDGEGDNTAGTVSSPTDIL